MPAESPSPVSITIVIPAYREEHRLPISLPALGQFVATLDRPLDVIVVDDGSPDATSRVVESFQRTMPYLTLIKNPHLGKGGAVRTGMLAAQGDGVILCDADFSMPPDNLPLFFGAWMPAPPS